MYLAGTRNNGNLACDDVLLSWSPSIDGPFSYESIAEHSEPK